MRGYFFYWFSCGNRALRWLCVFNGIPFHIKKLRKMEISFFDMKEYLRTKKIKSYCYIGKEILFDNSILQVTLKGQNHFIYLIKGFNKYCLIYDSSKLIVFRLRKKEKVVKSWTGYQLTLKTKVKLKNVFLRIISIFLTILIVQIFIFILKIVLNMV